jgi:hypothetical protein
MKTTKIGTALLIFALAFGFEANAQTAKNQTELPATAQTFITNNFAGQTISSLNVDKDRKSTEYDVRLSGGTSFEFDDSGNWEEIDGNKTALPTSVLPKGVADHINKSYAGQNVVKIEKNKKKYEVELGDGTELEFDLNGKFLKVD